VRVNRTEVVEPLFGLEAREEPVERSAWRKRPDRRERLTAPLVPAGAKLEFPQRPNRPSVFTGTSDWL
jgi:hypothetical protein